MHTQHIQEFNDDDSTVTLPAHVEFVSLSDVELWSIWEDWVMETWLSYCAAIVNTVNNAQVRCHTFTQNDFFAYDAVVSMANYCTST